MSHLSLLGRAENRIPPNPDEAKLDVFDNKYPGRDYTVTLTNNDFSSICPVTGQPDSAKLEITYIPDKLCVETKSLKYYLASYRNHPAFNEEIVNRICDDLVKACAPKDLIVKGIFVPRGGIQLSCMARHSK